MTIEVTKLIAAINPSLYCDDKYDESTGKKLSEQVEKIVESEGFLKAAETAEIKKSEFIDIINIQRSENVFSLPGFDSPIEQHTLIYDAFAQNLEPIYFWILDYVNGEYEGGIDKLVDNFVSSPGGGHFAEMSRRVTVLRDEATKQLGTVNTVIRSILNIIYDLKEFKLRLAHYDDLKSSDKNIKDSARLSLKQIWLDAVDIKRGNTALKAMAQQFDYVTLIDAFMVANSLEEVEKLDLNDRVKRILQQRLPEFERWIKESDKELKKRFEIEKTYLKSQVNSVKLYARWIKPAFEAARKLEQNLEPTAEIVNSFNTSLLKLVLLAKSRPYDISVDVLSGALPKFFKKMKFKKYIPLTVVEFVFRSAPDRTDQRGGYGYRGRVEVKFTSFALNEDELKVLKEKMGEDDFGDVYKFITGATDDSLAQIQDDIDELLGDKEAKEKEEEEKKKKEDANPFTALFDFLKRDDKKKEEKNFEEEGMPKDSEYEKVIRSQAILKARLDCRKLYDNYKKVHGMPAFPPTMT